MDVADVNIHSQSGAISPNAHAGKACEIIEVL
jgi:hypothetical protein